MKFLSSLLLAMVVAPGIQLAAQVNWDAYTPKQMKEILVERKECADPKVDLGICTDLHKYKSRVRYTGKIRELQALELQLVQGLIKTWGSESSLSKVFKVYHQAILVEQSQQQFWVLIQDALIPELKASVPPGKEMDVFIAIPGAMKSDLMFMMTGFSEVD